MTFKRIGLRLALGALMAFPAVTASPGGASAQNACGAVWRVSPGDTLSRISRACGIPSRDIQRLNPQIDWNRLPVGARVNLDGRGAGRPAPQPPASQPGDRYVVRPGDTLSSIARALGVSLQGFLAANPGLSERDLQVGRELFFGGGGSPQPPAPRPGGSGQFAYRDLSIRVDDREAAPGGTVRLRVSGVQPGERISVFASAQRGRERAETAARADRGGRVELALAIPREARPGGWLAELESERGNVLEAVSFEVRGGRPGGADGARVRISGVISNEGATCPTLRGEDGRLYSLAGDIGGWRGGDRVEVTGAIAEMSVCMQGTTIGVESIRPAR